MLLVRSVPPEHATHCAWRDWCFVIHLLQSCKTSRCKRKPSQLQKPPNKEILAGCLHISGGIPGLLPMWAWNGWEVSEPADGWVLNAFFVCVLPRSNLRRFRSDFALWRSLTTCAKWGAFSVICRFGAINRIHTANIAYFKNESSHYLAFLCSVTMLRH